MSEDEIVSTARRYIEDNFLYMKPGVRLDLDDSLLRKGVVDSMGVLEVLLFLEDTFDVRVLDNEVTEHNLGSLRSIGRFILSKRVGSAAA